jgi:hypothetical protein
VKTWERVVVVLYPTPNMHWHTRERRQVYDNSSRDFRR